MQFEIINGSFENLFVDVKRVKTILHELPVSGVRIIVIELLEFFVFRQIFIEIFLVELSMIVR